MSGAGQARCGFGFEQIPKAKKEGMKLNTRVFESYKGKYRNLVELAQTMGISQDLIYRAGKGERGINGRFIIGATKAFPGYKLDALFYVSED